MSNNPHSDESQREPENLDEPNSRGLAASGGRPTPVPPGGTTDPSPPDGGPMTPDQDAIGSG